MGNILMEEYSNNKYWNSLKKLESWLINNEYKGYDPFDGLSSYLHLLTFNNRFLQQSLQQFVRRNPLNLRPLLGIKPHRSTKGIGFIAGGYLNLFTLTNQEKYKTEALKWLDWLIENVSPGYTGYSWGNSFNYASRAFYLAKQQPTLVWSGLIGHEFIKAYQILGIDKYRIAAEKIAEFIISDLPRMNTQKGTCISYVAHEEVAIHNANLLGARHLAEVYKITRDPQLYEISTSAIEYSVNAQLENGAWHYGEETKYHWIDNWHTAYNLDSILGYKIATGNQSYDSALAKGLKFFIDHFFTDQGGPKYYWDQIYKYDIQSASQAIDTLCLFSAIYERPDLNELAEKIAIWTINNMQDPSGYFYLWKNNKFTNKTPTFHWGAATMFHALSSLLAHQHSYTTSKV